MLFGSELCAAQAQDESKPTRQNIIVDHTAPLRAIHMETLPYPEEARKKGIEGKVMLNIVVDATGNVSKVNALSGPQELVPAAIASAKMWQFESPPLRR